MTTSTTSPQRGKRYTPDSHSFPTRPYDLVKEMVVAGVILVIVTVALAASFGSLDEKAITLQDWAKAAPFDVVATATGELAGTTDSAGYGPPYNNVADGQKLGPLALQKWGGVRIPVDSAQDLVLTPLEAGTPDAALKDALSTWKAATADQQTAWATAYGDALAATPDGDPTTVAKGDYGPVPVMASSFLALATAGGLEQLISPNFYGGDRTKQLLLLADGSYLEDQARARSLGGDQWGMMNEAGNYPGQVWLGMMTFWYQIPAIGNSDNGDALVWGATAIIVLGFLFLPFLPGLRAIPEKIPVYKLVWRDYYRGQKNKK